MRYPIGTTPRKDMTDEQAVRGNRRPRQWLNLELAPPVPPLYVLQRNEHGSSRYSGGLRFSLLWRVA